MKTYVLILSKTFLKGHPKVGQPTNFKEKYLSGEKIHTIRNGDYWAKVVKEVNVGNAVLSVREWVGKPYASKQVELGQHMKLGWQDVEIIYSVNPNISKHDVGSWIRVDDVMLSSYYRDEVATNDGLHVSEFWHWFSKEDDSYFAGGIIHFTDFRY